MYAGDNGRGGGIVYVRAYGFLNFTLELCSEMQHLSREFEKWSCVEPTLGPLLSAISFALNVNSMHREEHLVKPIHNIVLQVYIEILACVC